MNSALLILACLHHRTAISCCGFFLVSESLFVMQPWHASDQTSLYSGRLVIMLNHYVVWKCMRVVVPELYPRSVTEQWEVVRWGPGFPGEGGRIFRPTRHVLVLYRRSGWILQDGKWYDHGGTGRTVCDASVPSVIWICNNSFPNCKGCRRRKKYILNRDKASWHSFMQSMHPVQQTLYIRYQTFSFPSLQDYTGNVSE